MMTVHYMPDKVEGDAFVGSFGMIIINGSVMFLGGRLRISGCRILLLNYVCSSNRMFVVPIISVCHGGKLSIEAQDVEICIDNLVIDKHVDVDIRLRNSSLTAHHIAKREDSNMKITSEDACLELPCKKFVLKDVKVENKVFEIGILVTDIDSFGVSTIRISGGILKIGRIVQATYCHMSNMSKWKCMRNLHIHST